jgi:hypothetical protein
VSLQREAILQRCRDLLLHRTAAGARVSVNQAEVDQLPGLPAISIYGVSETRGDFEEITPPRWSRRLKVLVEIKLVEDTSDKASLAMNKLAEQVERILLRNPGLPDAAGIDLVQTLRWSGMELVIDPNSRATIAGISISLEADYLYTAELEAPAHVRDLLGVTTTFDVGGDDTTVRLQDDVTLPGP